MLVQHENWLWVCLMIVLDNRMMNCLAMMMMLTDDIRCLDWLPYWMVRMMMTTRIRWMMYSQPMVTLMVENFAMTATTVTESWNLQTNWTKVHRILTTMNDGGDGDRKSQCFQNHLAVVRYMLVEQTFQAMMVAM